MSISRIGDLPAPVTAAKAHWSGFDGWMGFTPESDGPNAQSQCQSTINRQIGKGLVLEYITLAVGKPKQGFESNPVYLKACAEHKELAGRLIAVHRLRPTSRPLRDLEGTEEYDRIQDTWDDKGTRRRFSVAFPTVESYEIAKKPLAKAVFDTEAWKRLFNHSSGKLRILNDADREMIADLPLILRESSSAWVAIEDEIAMAGGSVIPPSVVRKIDVDLGRLAPEGMTVERWAQIRLRAAWKANGFATGRQRAGTLHCDKCAFDPVACLAGTAISPRSALDVHHKNPLAEGVRYTGFDDFALLCPTCHRIEHLLLKSQAA